MSQRHPLAQKKLTLDDYANIPHLMVAPLGMNHGYIDDQLLQRGRKRFVRLSVPEFLQISYELLGDNNIVTLPYRVAHDLSKSASLIIKPLPFDVPTIDYFLFWHRRFSYDNLSVWMRDLIKDILIDSTAN